MAVRISATTLCRIHLRKARCRKVTLRRTTKKLYPLACNPAVLSVFRPRRCPTLPSRSNTVLELAMRATRVRHMPCMHLAAWSRDTLRPRNTPWNFLVRLQVRAIQG